MYTLTLKFTWKCIGPRIFKTILKKNNTEDLNYMTLRLFMKPQLLVLCDSGIKANR